jgi:hypothetical protein
MGSSQTKELELYLRKVLGWDETFVNVHEPQIHESALSREVVDAEILRAIAKHPHQLLVSTKEDGYYCSFDRDDVLNLTYCKRPINGMYPFAEEVLTREAFHDELVNMLKCDFWAPREVTVPLYSQGIRVREGLFIHYNVRQCYLGGVYVRSTLELNDP